MSKFNGVKTNNAKIDAKIKLREMLDCRDKNVLEVYCGEGIMFNDVWHLSRHYEGIDIKKYDDDRIVHIGDAATVLKTIDLSMFDIFDIDAYGSPYECLFIIANRLKKQCVYKNIDFVVTDGLQIDLRMGNIEKYLALLSGVDSTKVNGIHKVHNMLINNVINNVSNMLSMNVESKKIAIGKTGSGMRYFSFRLKNRLENLTS